MFKKKHSIDTLFALLLYGMFTVLSLLIVLLGSQIYRTVVDKTSMGSDVRMASSYVVNKIRGGDAAGCIRLDDINGINVLILEEKETDIQYETLIYYYDGAMRELLQKPGDMFRPEQGEKLVSAAGLSIREEKGMFIITASSLNGMEHILYVDRRS